jgi:hypothetical protein
VGFSLSIRNRAIRLLLHPGLLHTYLVLALRRSPSFTLKARPFASRSASGGSRAGKGNLGRAFERLRPLPAMVLPVTLDDHDYAVLRGAVVVYIDFTEGHFLKGNTLSGHIQRRCYDNERSLHWCLRRAAL